MFGCFFLFKQKTAYEMRISDWSSDVCSSDLAGAVYRATKPESRLRSALVLVDIGDRVLDGRDLLGSIVGDFDAEFFLERHHQLDDVEAVSAEIVDEARVLGDLVGLDAEMLDDDLLHAIGGLAHVPSPSDRKSTRLNSSH